MLEKVSAGGPVSHDDSSSDLPLYVSLERALLRTRIEVEVLLALLVGYPGEVLRFLRALLAGKANAARFLRQRQTILDAGSMPCDQDVLDYICKVRAQGRPVILVSDISGAFAERTARAVPVFDEIVGPMGTSTSEDESTLSRIRDNANGKSFD